jgi:RHS repeat-associated protein
VTAAEQNAIEKIGDAHLNRLTAKHDSRGRSLAFSYDRVGNLLGKTTYQGTTTRYVYNAAHRLVMLSNPAYTQVDYQYDPAGRLLARSSANGARLIQTFDANGWLSRLEQYDAANHLVSQTSYTRDRVGNILSQTDAGGTTSYTLDALYRLTAADHPGTTDDEHFSYDRVGNRLSATTGGLGPGPNTRHYRYTAGSNRLAEIRSGTATGPLEAAFSHDLEGRLTHQTGAGARTLTWDAKGRLRTLTRPGSATETYHYDPMDYRIGRRGGALGPRDYFLEGEHLESEYAGDQRLARYFRGVSVDELVAAWLLESDGRTRPYLFHHDQVNSVSAVSGHNGSTLQTLRYRAFGPLQASTGSSPNRLRYTGREDDGTGLYYYRARYYDPELGRFISEDPLGFDAGDVNFYAYVENNPVNHNDPSGKILPAIAAACAANPVACAAITSGLASVATGLVTRHLTGEQTTAGDVVFDAALGAVGGSAAQGAFRYYQGRQAGVGIARSRYIGEIGEKAAGVPVGKRKTKTDIPEGGWRVPDMKTTGSLMEVKNVAAIRSGDAAQIRDLVKAAQKGAQNVVVHTRHGTDMGRIRGLLDSGAISQRFLPNVADDGFRMLSPLQRGGIGVAAGVLGNIGGGSRAGSSRAGSAGGGFLLYPNKVNANMMQSVYAK